MKNGKDLGKRVLEKTEVVEFKLKRLLFNTEKRGNKKDILGWYHSYQGLNEEREKEVLENCDEKGDYLNKTSGIKYNLNEACYQEDPSSMFHGKEHKIEGVDFLKMGRPPVIVRKIITGYYLPKENASQTP